MRKIQRILVAVESPGTQWSPAVAKATQIARVTGARLELFHGIDTRLYVEALDTYEGGLAGFTRNRHNSTRKFSTSAASSVTR
jgi:nucleotide-binding universal stress UspA family protein